MSSRLDSSNMVKYDIEVLECFFFWFSARLCANGDLSTNSPIKSAALQDFIVARYFFVSSVLLLYHGG